jgi:hypothetical protein
MLLTGENLIIPRKSCPSVILTTKNPALTDPRANPSLHVERPANNLLSHGKALKNIGI